MRPHAAVTTGLIATAQDRRRRTDVAVEQHRERDHRKAEGHDREDKADRAAVQHQLPARPGPMWRACNKPVTSAAACRDMLKHRRALALALSCAGTGDGP